METAVVKVIEVDRQTYWIKEGFLTSPEVGLPRGEYDTAVFQALKEVGMAVRQAGRFGSTDLGIDLIRKAFEAKGGPLTDPSAPMLEREALAHLFAGAIGSYKNPHSHRNVPITAKEAAEMVMPASHLLRIVDSHAGAS